MPKKRILVTGGAGFIGSNFCNYHCQEPQGLDPAIRGPDGPSGPERERQPKGQKYDVVALDNLLLGDPSHLSPEVTFVEGDTGDRALLESLGKFDVIIHFAGTSSAPMFQKDLVGAYRNSILSFVEVLEHAHRSGVKKVLYASTSSLYGNTPPPLTEDQSPIPTNHYSVTKIAMEHISTCYHRTHPEIDIIGFRFMSVYGPHEEHKGIYANLISQFVWAILRGEPPIIYDDGSQTRDFTNVRDVVQGITLAMETDKNLGNDIFNIGTGTSTTLCDLVATINKVLGTHIAPHYVENPVKESYVLSQQADISKICSVLGFCPSVSLEDGIRHLAEAYRNQKKKSHRDRTREANTVP